MVERRLSSYELVRLLGEGGMARVYLARDVRLGRDVAVKVLADHLAQRQGFRERFLREARLAAALDHPNIVPIYDFGEENALFLVMPFISGGSLQQVARQGPMDSARVATVGAQIADALDYAHQRNVVHRDVKPANILIHADGRMMLSDFGLAKIAAAGAPITKRNRPDAGTPEYMAPEQIEGHSDPRADIYGLGVVLYLLLTGRLPFSGPTPGAVMEGHLTRLAEPPRRINPSITPAMEAVVLRALAKHPDDRYQSASELGAALLAALVAGDAEPLPFMGEDSGLPGSLPPWLSGPSLPVTRSMPSIMSAITAGPAAHVTAPPAWGATEPPPQQPTPRAPVTTRILPTIAPAPLGQAPLAQMPPAPPSSVVHAGPSGISGQSAQSAQSSHSAQANSPVSPLASLPSLSGRVAEGLGASAASGVSLGDPGWSRPLDRRDIQLAAGAGVSQGPSLANSQSTSQVIGSMVPAGHPAGMPMVRAMAPQEAGVTGPPLTTPPASDAEERAEEGGARLWPVLLVLLALLLVTAGVLVGWVLTHHP